MNKPPVSVQVAHVYEATAERVFDAWLDTNMIGRWLFGSGVREEEILHLELDARVGGRFSFKVKRGADVIDHVGEYLEIERPRRLVFSWGVAGESDGESRVIVEITAQENGCRLLLTHEIQPQWAEYADRARDSWRYMLGKLAEAL